MLRYIALDLDGTLTNEDKVITPLTYQALMNAQSKGVRLILASGRPPYGMQPLCDQLLMNKYHGIMLAYNGGHIEECQTGKVLTEIMLDERFLPEIYSFQQKFGMTLMTYYDDSIYTENPSSIYVQQSSKNNNMKVVKVNNFITDAPRPINKCLIVGAPTIAPLCEVEMQKTFKEKLNICRSTPYFIEVLPPGIDKGIALADLMTKLNTTTDHLLAFGDSYNDICMLQTAGISVAMGNAEEDVKRIANYITLSNEDDGIAAFLKSFYNF